MEFKVSKLTFKDTMSGKYKLEIKDNGQTALTNEFEMKDEKVY